MDRWWAPQRPTTEPDAVVLAMLEPGDLGSALLAAHRAGAAAMETVSKAALPSESALVAAMVTARANVAEKVVDSVSKAVRTPTYAALLVRDVLDEAEEAALSVYRTAVSKGVSPPVAAARAAAIYGVPAPDLGRYFQLATDPRSNPVAVTDAADRALMTYVSKLVTEEAADGEVVEFSKAPVAEHHHNEPTVSAGWQEQLHPRDTEGQFVRKPTSHAPPVTYAEPDAKPAFGSLAWLRQQLHMAELPTAPAKVADVVETKPTPPAPAKRRTARRGRVARSGVKRQPSLTRTGGALERKGTLERKPTLERVQAQLKRLGELTRVTDKLNRSAGDVAGTETRDTDSPTLPDFLRSRDRMEMAYDLDHSLAFVVDRDTAREFITQLADQAGSLTDRSQRIFRAGYLIDRAGNPEIASSQSARENLRHEAEALTSGEDYQSFDPPKIKKVKPHDMRRNAQHVEDYLNQLRAEMATPQIPGSNFVSSTVDPALLSQTKVYPVWRPVDAEDEDPSSGEPEVFIVQFDRRASQPIVDEFVIVHGARGQEEGTGQHIEYELNPHQAYRVVNAPGTLRGARLAPQQLWDAQNGVVVNRWYLEPVDESGVEDLLGGQDVNKAERQARRPRLNVTFEQLHPRDEEGRFTDALGRPSLPSPSSLPTREPRQARTARTGRTGRTRRTVTTEREAALERSGTLERKGTLTRAGVQRPVIDGLVRGALERRKELTSEKVERLPDMPVLDDRKRYIVLNSADRERFLRDQHTDGTQATTLTGARWTMELALSSSQLLDGSGVMGKLNYGTQRDIDDAEGPAMGGFTWNRRPVGKGMLRPGHDDDELNLGSHIAKIFADRPEIAQVHIDYGDGEYTLYANRKPVKPQAVIEIDEDVDWHRPLTLIPLGQYRANEMLMRRSDVPGSPLTSAISQQEGASSPVNASVMAFLLQNSKVDRYRVQNTDAGNDDDLPLFRV